MTLNLDTLRKIAEAATPGPWEIDNLDRVVRTPDRGIVHDDSCADSEEWSANTDAPFIASFDPPTVLALLSRLERAEARVKLLESGIVTELATTSVNAAQTIGIEVSWISEAILKMGYAEVAERLEQAEQAVARVREVATGDPTEYGWSEAMFAVLRALDGEQA